MAYTNADTNMTTSAGLSAGMQTYYNRELLRTFEPNLVHLQFGDEHRMPPHSGLVMNMRKIIPLETNTKALSEGDPGDSVMLAETEVTVQLLRDGAVYDTVTLSAGNGWSHTWSGLDDSCTWTVVEKECEGYTVRVEREGITFVMTNTYAAEIPDDPTPEAPLPPDPAKPTPGGPTLPQTGQVWWPVPFLLMTGLLLLAVGLFRRRTTGDEG